MIEQIKIIQEGIKRIQEGIQKNQEGIERNQEGIERNQEGLERIQEEIKRNHERNLERIEEIKRNREALERRIEVLERNVEELRRIQEGNERRERINENDNDNEIKDILKQLPVTIIEDMNRLNDENKKCVICFEDFKNFDKSIYLPCIHLFHEKCITDWINTKKGFCPICRSKIWNTI